MLKRPRSLPRVSQCVCDAALRKQILVHDRLKSVRDAARAWYPHISLCLFHIYCIVLFPKRSASPRLPVLQGLLYNTGESDEHAISRFKSRAESIQCAVMLSNDIGQISELQMSVVKPIAVTSDKRPCMWSQTLITYPGNSVTLSVFSFGLAAFSTKSLSPFKKRPSLCVASVQARERLTLQTLRVAAFFLESKLFPHHRSSCFCYSVGPFTCIALRMPHARCLDILSAFPEKEPRGLMYFPGALLLEVTIKGDVDVVLYRAWQFFSFYPFFFSFLLEYHK